MSFDPNRLISVSCPICGQSDSYELYPSRFESSSVDGYSFSARRKATIQHFRIVKCSSCGLVRSDPVLRREDVENFYQQSHFLYVDESAYAGQTYLNLVNRLLGSDLKINMRILDIGCGNGFFLKKMFEAGFTNVGGVEPSKDAAENADPEIKGCIDIRCFSEASHTPNSFELVTVFHLLDHIHEPIEFLNNCRNVLNKDGVIVIVCHDVDALSAKLLGERSPIFDIQHTHLYSQKTIRMLLEKCGFEVMSIGSLWNTYPLGYWIQSLTITEWLAKYIPECIAKIPLTLPAGNLYASARVKK